MKAKPVLLIGCILLLMLSVSACGDMKEAATQREEAAVTEVPAESDGPVADAEDTSAAEDGTGVRYCEDELFRFQIPEGSFQPKNSTGICMKPSEEYQMYLRELGAANGMEDIAEAPPAQAQGAYGIEVAAHKEVAGKEGPRLAADHRAIVVKDGKASQMVAYERAGKRNDMERLVPAKVGPPYLHAPACPTAGRVH